MDFKRDLHVLGGNISCSIEGCEKGGRLKRTWCSMHYSRWRKHGNPSHITVYRATCIVGGCERKFYGRDLCAMHYQRAKARGGDVGGAEPLLMLGLTSCTHGDCPSPPRSRGLCGKHYQRLLKFGSGNMDKTHSRHPDHIMSYGGVHNKVKRLRGLAKDRHCVECGKPAAQWAFDHLESAPLFGPKGQPYALDIERYIPLCGSCHTILDKEEARKRRGE